MEAIDVVGAGATWLMFAAQAMLCLGLGGIAWLLARVAPLRRPQLGQRGVERRRARAGSLLFWAIEPLLRFAGALLARLLPARARVALDALITRSGSWLGLSPEECVALCALSGAAGLALAGLAGGVLPPLAMTIVACGAALFPLLKLHGMAAQRALLIGRRLPAAIDLLSLCMGAGMDFVGALRLFVDEHACSDDALVQELRHVLQALSVGHTRRDALLAFAQRAPAPAVRDFTSALVQAEQKGTPIADVLALQAQVLRMRRSVAAEEAAARASVMLVFPMLLLLACVLLIVLGPFIVNGVAL